MLYRRLIRPFFFLFDAETAHGIAFFFLRLAAAIPGVNALIRAAVGEVRAPVRLWDLEFPNPLGVAAGFDKDAQAFETLGALGFGFVEVGTVTARPQPGNPKPRLFRLPADRALINRMGFNNEGARAAAVRLRHPRRTLVGVNIGKNKDVAADRAATHFAESAEALAPYADYLVVNVSSPNTPGLRDLQAVSALEPILAAVRDAADRASPGRRVPLLVKIAPDLADDDVDAVADLATRMGLEGIVATNTTIARDGLRTPANDVAALGTGGMSGAPLKARSLAVLKRLKARVGDRLVLVAAGGIETAEDARERLEAGASLVQAYTAFIYEGPGFAVRTARALSTRSKSVGS